MEDGRMEDGWMEDGRMEDGWMEDGRMEDGWREDGRREDGRREDGRSPAEAGSMDRERSRRLYPRLPQEDGPRGLHGRSAEAHAKVSDSERLKIQILILEEQKRELLLVNQRWAREYRTLSQFYSQKFRELRAGLQLGPARGERKTAAGPEGKDEDSVKAEESRGEAAAELRVQTRRVGGVSGPCGDQTPAGTLEDVWKHQAEVYREDFLKERSDREKLQGSYLELENKYRRACRQLGALRPQVCFQADRRCRSHQISEIGATSDDRQQRLELLTTAATLSPNHVISPHRGADDLLVSSA